jgi:hypothetical protein
MVQFESARRTSTISIRDARSSYVHKWTDGAVCFRFTDPIAFTFDHTGEQPGLRAGFIR